MADDRDSALSENVSKISIEGLDHLISEILSTGYRLLGPTVRHGAVVYDEISGSKDLPVGYSDEQSPGEYRLHEGKAKSVFRYVVGPQSWKKYLHPPLQHLGVYDRGLNLIQSNGPTSGKQPLALLGVRPCEIRAIEIQDRVFLQGPFIDRQYDSNRTDLLIVAVNCMEPASTCFCTSMGTGPTGSEGFDLCLTEVTDRKNHFFLVQVGSDKGADLLEKVPHEAPTDNEIKQAETLLEKAERKIGRTLKTEGLPEILNGNFEHPRWEETGRRCLSCGNCTMVCPTCFCTTVEEVTDLTGEKAQRWKRWDSCFTAHFSYIHGGSVRPTTRSRYRQWMTHKLSNWVDQFRTMGCVGCGRCLTWCPVGIDITEEAAYIREHDLARKSSNRKGEHGHEDH